MKVLNTFALNHVDIVAVLQKQYADVYFSC